MESNGTLWSEKPTWSQPDFLRWNKFKESSGSRLDQGPFFWLFATSQVLPKCFAIFMLLYCYLFCKFFLTCHNFTSWYFRCHLQVIHSSKTIQHGVAKKNNHRRLYMKGMKCMRLKSSEILSNDTSKVKVVAIPLCHSASLSEKSAEVAGNEIKRSEIRNKSK